MCSTDLLGCWILHDDRNRLLYLTTLSYRAVIPSLIQETHHIINVWINPVLQLNTVCKAYLPLLQSFPAPRRPLEIFGMLSPWPIESEKKEWFIHCMKDCGLKVTNCSILSWNVHVIARTDNGDLCSLNYWFISKCSCMKSLQCISCTKLTNSTIEKCYLYMTNLWAMKEFQYIYYIYYMYL